MFVELLSDLVVILLFALLLEFRLVLPRAPFCLFISRVFWFVHVIGLFCILSCIVLQLTYVCVFRIQRHA